VKNKVSSSLATSDGYTHSHSTDWKSNLKKTRLFVWTNKSIEIVYLKYLKRMWCFHEIIKDCARFVFLLT